MTTHDKGRLARAGRRFGAPGAALALALTAATFALPPTAQAHEASQIISRSGCLYAAYSNSNISYAYTEKRTGSCSGHGWVRIKYQGTWSSWVHSAGRAEITAPAGIQASQHKTCSDCSVVTINH